MDLDVVVCTKNRAVFLSRVLKQIVREVPFKNLIIIYGSSEDGTKKIAENFTDKVFWDGDKGLGAARNLGMRKASSELVAMIDTDVILEKGWFELMIDYLKDPTVAAVMGSCIFGYGCLPLERLWRYYSLRDRENWGCSNTIFNRHLVLKVGNFDEKIRGACEDYDLYVRLLNAGYKWIWVKEAAVFHPLTMGEYLNRVLCWSRARASPEMRELTAYLAKTSLTRVYFNSVCHLIKAAFEGVRLSSRVHPTMLLYFPLMQTTTRLTCLKELKKIMQEDKRD
jgi:glycosyltransferase involved in cell wall biosynthesis